MKRFITLLMVCLSGLWLYAGAREGAPDGSRPGFGDRRYSIGGAVEYSYNKTWGHHGNFDIEDYAYTGQRGQGAVQTYQGLLTQITIDIITLEILTNTPIITNTTTEITLDEDVTKSEKQIARENKEVERRIKKAAEEQQKREEEELKQADKEAKALEKEAKKAKKENK